MPIQIKQKGIKINPWPWTTAYLYWELLSLLTGKPKKSIQVQFYRKKLSLRNITDVVQYIKHIYNLK